MDIALLNVIVFYLAAAVAVGGAFLVIWQKNPVASALFMIVSLLAQAILYVQLDAVFVAAILVIVYAGAIVTLFLFVIMLLNLRSDRFVTPAVGISRFLKLGLAGFIGAELVYLISKTVMPKMSFDVLPTVGFGSVELVAERLFFKYLYGFELTSILLLVAIVGAVVLTRQALSEDSSKGEGAA